MEQKSGCVLQTVLSEGESKGQRVSPSAGGSGKWCQVSKYIQAVNSGLLEKGQVVGLQNRILGPSLRKAHMSQSNFMLVVLRCRCIGPNIHDSKELILKSGS